jgi:hypothetical protein
MLKHTLHHHHVGKSFVDLGAKTLVCSSIRFSTRAGKGGLAVRLQLRGSQPAAPAEADGAINTGRTQTAIRLNATAGIGIVSRCLHNSINTAQTHFEQIPMARKLKSQENSLPRGEFQQTPRAKPSASSARPDRAVASPE